MSDRTLVDRETIRIDSGILAAIDRHITNGLYPDRSAAIRTAVRSLITNHPRRLADSEPRSGVVLDTRITIRLPASLEAEIERACEEYGGSVASVVRTAIHTELLTHA